MAQQTALQGCTAPEPLSWREKAETAQGQAVSVEGVRGVRVSGREPLFLLSHHMLFGGYARSIHSRARTLTSRSAPTRCYNPYTCLTFSPITFWRVAADIGSTSSWSSSM